MKLKRMLFVLLLAGIMIMTMTGCNKIEDIISPGEEEETSPDTPPISQPASTDGEEGTISAAITSVSGLEIEEGDDEFTAIIVAKVVNNTDSDAEDISLELTLEADETIPDVKDAELSGGGLSWVFTGYNDDTLYFASSAELEIDRDKYKKITLTLDVEFEYEVYENITFDPDIDLHLNGEEEIEESEPDTGEDENEIEEDDDAITAEIAFTSGLEIEEDDDDFTATIAIEVRNTTDEDAENLALAVSIEADDDIPNVEYATLSGGNLAWSFRSHDNSTLNFLSSAGLDIEEDEDKTLTLELDVKFADEVDDDIDFIATVDIDEEAANIFAAVTDSYGLEIDRNDDDFEAIIEIRVYNDTGNDIEDIALELSLEADEDIPDVEDAELSDGVLTWKFSKQDDETLYFTSTAALDIDKGEYEDLTLDLEIEFEDDVEEDTIFEPSVKIKRTANLTVIVTNTSGLEIDRGDDDFEATLEIKVYNYTEDDVENIALLLALESDEVIPDVKFATLTGDGLAWKFTSQDDEILYFESSAGLYIQENDEERLSLDLEVQFSEDADDDTVFTPIVEINNDPDEVIAVITSVSHLDIDEGDSRFSGDIDVKVYNYSDDDIEDVELWVYLEADEDIPDIEYMLITGGGLTWKFVDQDNELLYFYNYTGFDIDEGEYEKLTIDFTVEFEHDVDDDTNFYATIEVEDYEF